MTGLKKNGKSLKSLWKRLISKKQVLKFFSSCKSMNEYLIKALTLKYPNASTTKERVRQKKSTKTLQNNTSGTTFLINLSRAVVFIWSQTFFTIRIV